MKILHAARCEFMSWEAQAMRRKISAVDSAIGDVQSIFHSNQTTMVFRTEMPFAESTASFAAAKQASPTTQWRARVRVTEKGMTAPPGILVLRVLVLGVRQESGPKKRPP